MYSFPLDFVAPKNNVNFELEDVNVAAQDVGQPVARVDQYLAVVSESEMRPIREYNVALALGVSYFVISQFKRILEQVQSLLPYFCPSLEEHPDVVIDLSQDYENMGFIENCQKVVIEMLIALENSLKDEFFSMRRMLSSQEMWEYQTEEQVDFMNEVQEIFRSLRNKEFLPIGRIYQSNQNLLAYIRTNRIIPILDGVSTFLDAEVKLETYHLMSRIYLDQIQSLINHIAMLSFDLAQCHTTGISCLDENGDSNYQDHVMFKLESFAKFMKEIKSDDPEVKKIQSSLTRLLPRINNVVPARLRAHCNRMVSILNSVMILSKKDVRDSLVQLGIWVDVDSVAIEREPQVDIPETHYQSSQGQTTYTESDEF